MKTEEINRALAREDFGLLARQIRQKHGLTQSEVAEKLGVTPGYISNVENNRTALSLRALLYYARLEGRSLEDLMADDMTGSTEENDPDQELIDEIMKEIRKMPGEDRQKLLRVLKVMNE